MTSPDANIRKYLQTLSVTDGITATAVKIYDRVPEVLAYPFVYISDINSAEISIAGGTMWDVDLLLDIVTGSTSNSGGRKQADGIGNSLLTALLDSPYVDIGTHYICKATLLNSNYLDEDAGDTYIIRKLLRINLQIEYDIAILIVSNEPEVNEYISGLSTPLSAGQITKLNTFVSSIKNGLAITNLSDAFDVIYLLAGETSESSLRNLVKNANHSTAINSPIFTQFEGFTGNASDMYINTNYTPSTEAVNLTLNSGAFGVYSRKEVALGTKSVFGGDSGSLISIGLQSKVSATIMRYVVNGGRLNNSAGNSTVTETVNTGMHIVSRVASTSVNYYRNKVKYSMFTSTSVGLYNAKLFILASSLATTPLAFTDEQVSFVFVSKGLTQSQIDTVTNAIETYMDANGKGIIG